MHDVLRALCEFFEEDPIKADEWMASISKKDFVELDDLKRLGKVIQGAEYNAGKILKDRFGKELKVGDKYDKGPFIRAYREQMIYYVRRINDESVQE